MNTDTGAAMVAALTARLEVLEAREVIRDVMYRYARAADRCDLDLLKSCFWPDGTDCHWFWNGNAHDFADHVIPLLRELPNTQHSVTNPIIDLDGDRAFAESQVYALLRVPLDDATFVDQQYEMRYLDVFERRDGQWRILHRQTATESMREFVTANLARSYPADHPLTA